MKQAAIAIDNWKLPIFSRQLKQAGYNYTVVDGLTNLRKSSPFRAGL